MVRILGLGEVSHGDASRAFRADGQLSVATPIRLTLTLWHGISTRWARFKAEKLGVVAVQASTLDEKAGCLR